MLEAGHEIGDSGECRWDFNVCDALKQEAAAVPEKHEHSRAEPGAIKKQPMCVTRPLHCVVARYGVTSEKLHLAPPPSCLGLEPNTTRPSPRRSPNTRELAARAIAVPRFRIVQRPIVAPARGLAPRLSGWSWAPICGAIPPCAAPPPAAVATSD